MTNKARDNRDKDDPHKSSIICDTWFRFLGFIKPGLPEFEPPPFQTEVGNNTYNFVEMSSTLGPAIIIVPLLSILENIALAKVFGKSLRLKQTKLANKL